MDNLNDEADIKKRSETETKGSLSEDFTIEPTQPGETSSPEKKWYVVRVQSGKEEKVKSNLEKRVALLGLQDQISNILVPTELVSEIKKGAKKIVERKLYPGYVMVEMELTEEIHYAIRSTPGVGDVAGVMSDNEVERLFLTCAHAKEKPKLKVSFHKGQTIKIKEGAFENYDGIVDEVNEQKGIIKVRIEIFGRYTQVELGYWQVESI